MQACKGQQVRRWFLRNGSCTWGAGVKRWAAGSCALEAWGVCRVCCDWRLRRGRWAAKGTLKGRCSGSPQYGAAGRAPMRDVAAGWLSARRRGIDASQACCGPDAWASRPFPPKPTLNHIKLLASHLAPDPHKPGRSIPGKHDTRATAPQKLPAPQVAAAASGGCRSLRSSLSSATLPGKTLARRGGGLCSGFCHSRAPPAALRTLAARPLEELEDQLQRPVVVQARQEGLRRGRGSGAKTRR